MAYIDPEGMFGGDRMAMLSDSAKMAWPWFWCASNTLGRVELNYREFVRTVFRQFRKPPTEKQFWDWVAEFHEAYLMFAYQTNGQAWGQWDVSEKYLPTYKTKSDKNTPPPNAQEYLVWRKRYTEYKQKQLAGKCRVFSISENFSKLSETSEEFPIGEERRDYGEIIKPPCSADAELEMQIPTEQLWEEPQPPKFSVETAHERWYRDAYWLRVAPKDSLRAYGKAIERLRKVGMERQQAADYLFEMAVEDREKFEGTDAWSWRQKLHPATWLNGERWKDEAPTFKSAVELAMERI